MRVPGCRNPSAFFKALPVVALLAFALPIAGQEVPPSSETFRGAERITAIDLVVSFDLDPLRNWAVASPVPDDLRIEDFEVVVGSQPRQIITVEHDDPWEIVLWFDSVLTSTSDLRRAATILAAQAADLVRLGTVEIVVADPEPVLRLPSTRDVDRLVATLGQLMQADGRDELTQLRSEVLDELRRTEQDRGDLDLDASELCEAAAREEERIVRRAQDRLLLWLVEKEKHSAKRAVVLVQGGFDAAPGTFYRPLSPAPVTEWPDLTAATEDLARNLAAYSWVVVGLVPEDREPLRRGKKIGKFRANFKPQARFVEQYNEAAQDYEVVLLLHLLNMTYEETRKPSRAEAYLELGLALHAQGNLGRAEDALRQALHFFAGDRQTAGRQAVAFVELGEVLEQRGREQQARYAFELARRVDADYALAKLGPPAELLSPLASLETLTETTAGQVVRDDPALTSILAHLGRRVRLTFQVGDDVDGSLEQVEVRYRQDWRRPVHPGWTRLATTDAVAAARVRRLLAGEPSSGDADVRVLYRLRQGGQRQIETRLTLAGSGLPQDPREEARFRVTLGLGGPDVEPQIRHLLLEPRSLEDSPVWVHRATVEDSPDRPWVAVVIEDLHTGIWGGRLLDR